MLHEPLWQRVTTLEPMRSVTAATPCLPTRVEPANAFDEKRVEKGFCKTHRPVDLSHVEMKERAARRLQLREQRHIRPVVRESSLEAPHGI